MTDKNVAIHVENLSKIYRLGTKEDIHENLVNSAINFIRNPLKNYRRYRSLYKFDEAELQADQQADDILWAVKNISFDVRQGEVLGIIGHNGAGKSTLLKILCRITDPTRGKAIIHGRISSLLEVGTGFHPELTGRENVYLNGTILGMTRTEINRKFDEIVDFSGVSKFIDTPVKRYSSGMTVRLAFSVAAHLEPEILIIDEVLAVGDADFQKKCINKMEDVGQEGRTVLFVSHNMPAVSRLCSRALLVEKGQIAEDGPAGEVIGKYLNRGQQTPASKVWHDPDHAPGGDVIKLREIKIVNGEGVVTETFDIREPVRIEMTYDVIKSGFELLPHFHVWNESEVCILTTIDNDPQWREKPRPVGTYTSSVELPGNFLSNGRFDIYAAILTLNPMSSQFFEKGVVAFHVLDGSGWDTARGIYNGNLQCVVRPLLDWETTTT